VGGLHGGGVKSCYSFVDWPNESFGFRLLTEKAVAEVNDRIQQDIDDADNMNLDEEPWTPSPVILVDESLAMVYARSEQSKKEFPDYRVTLKTAIAMARQIQVRNLMRILLYSEGVEEL